MLTTSLLASLFLMQATPETAAQSVDDGQNTLEESGQPTPPAPRDPNIDVVETKPEKITDKRHPDYVRCKSQAVIGSRAKRKRTCMTNHQWKMMARQGNQFSRDLVDQNRDGFMSGQGGLGGGTNTGLGGLGGG